MRALTRRWHAAGDKVALVPTMGALHEGHISLLRTGKQRAQRTITSIFVNPTQFAPNEDFDKYPRTWDDDLRILAAAGCDAVWAPTVKEMYPEGFDTFVEPGGAAKGLETNFRPAFFRGVTTVCCKLFGQTQADAAVFGEKDFQQLAVVTQMVRDLNLPIEIVPAPTVREADGLAMSSRNRYLAAEQRTRAATLFRVISDIADAAKAGGDIEGALGEGQRRIAAAGFGKIDYLVVRDAATLGPYDRASKRPGRVLVAAWLGQTRLIDNIAV